MQNLNPDNFYVDQTFYSWNCQSPDLWALYTNSTMFVIFLHLATSEALGGGLLRPTTEEMEEIVIPNPHKLLLENELTGCRDIFSRPIHSIFEELGLPTPNRDYSNVHPDDISLDKVLPDRRALDEVVFEALGLTDEEQLAVYRAVVELVRNRLVKARSV